MKATRVEQYTSASRPRACGARACGGRALFHWRSCAACARAPCCTPFTHTHTGTRQHGDSRQPRRGPGKAGSECRDGGKAGLPAPAPRCAEIHRAQSAGRPQSVPAAANAGGAQYGRGLLGCTTKPHALCEDVQRLRQDPTRLIPNGETVSELTAGPSQHAGECTVTAKSPPSLSARAACAGWVRRASAGRCPPA